MYDAKISPYKRLNEFNNDEIKRLYYSCLKILKEAYLGFGYEGSPYSLSLNKLYKIDKDKYICNVYKKNKDKLGNKVEIINDQQKIYWVSKIQK